MVINEPIDMSRVLKYCECDQDRQGGKIYERNGDGFPLASGLAYCANNYTLHEEGYMLP